MLISSKFNVLFKGISSFSSGGIISSSAILFIDVFISLELFILFTVFFSLLFCNNLVAKPFVLLVEISVSSRLETLLSKTVFEFFKSRNKIPFFWFLNLFTIFL